MYVPSLFLFYSKQSNILKEFKNKKYFFLLRYLAWFKILETKIFMSENSKNQNHNSETGSYFKLILSKLYHLIEQYSWWRVLAWQLLFNT